jgi:anti-anti-sigma regulatory factor
MKFISFKINTTYVIEFPECDLNIKSISNNLAYPIVPAHSTSILLRLEKVKQVDSIGLSWLLQLCSKYKNLGLTVSTGAQSVVADAIKLLELEDQLPLFESNLKKEAM